MTPTIGDTLTAAERWTEHALSNATETELLTGRIDRALNLLDADVRNRMDDVLTGRDDDGTQRCTDLPTLRRLADAADCLAEVVYEEMRS